MGTRGGETQDTEIHSLTLLPPPERCGELDGTSRGSGELDGTSRGSRNGADSMGSRNGADCVGSRTGMRGLPERTLARSLWRPPWLLGPPGWSSLESTDAREAQRLGGALAAQTLGGALATRSWTGPAGTTESWTGPAEKQERACEELPQEGAVLELAQEGAVEEQAQEGAVLKQALGGALEARSLGVRSGSTGTADRALTVNPTAGHCQHYIPDLSERKPYVKVCFCSKILKRLPLFY